MTVTPTVPTDPFSVPVRQDNVSNVVGYIAGGAFVMYVPDWIVEHWGMENSSDWKVFTFYPHDSERTRVHSAVYSDIVINIATSTEAFNANTLYDLDRGAYTGNPSAIMSSVKSSSMNISINGDSYKESTADVLISEILINKSDDARIYHIERRKDGKIYDTFYLDGKEKTAQFLFSADESVHGIYAPKVRDLVQGFGPGKGAQG